MNTVPSTAPARCRERRSPYLTPTDSWLPTRPLTRLPGRPGSPAGPPSSAQPGVSEKTQMTSNAAGISDPPEPCSWKRSQPRVQVGQDTDTHTLFPLRARAPPPQACSSQAVPLQCSLGGRSDSPQNHCLPSTSAPSPAPRGHTLPWEGRSGPQSARRSAASHQRETFYGVRPGGRALRPPSPKSLTTTMATGTPPPSGNSRTKPKRRHQEQRQRVRQLRAGQAVLVALSPRPEVGDCAADLGSVATSLGTTAAKGQASEAGLCPTFLQKQEAGRQAVRPPP